MLCQIEAQQKRVRVRVRVLIPILNAKMVWKGVRFGGSCTEGMVSHGLQFCVWDEVQVTACRSKGPGGFVEL